MKNKPFFLCVSVRYALHNIIVKLTIGLTLGDGAVNMAFEGGVGHIADVVVGLNVFLDRLTTGLELVNESAWVSWDGSMT